ncbi:putative protein N(5)-glutamine methyltransferase [Microbispora sp. RL4-1S]|uniref:peptide chain release factor N(5)-glutamine methyltransferase n=1 Tax=Microbispora oryzae TaxID=2806554 RepID=A0A940WLQ2_9ACTN|nr:putative protein N(5)-glutamine methyltransferase [Microbispora oryzae]MBP2707945.1 putative protein N(5)-glutamine methyltransferase [Microbispora oryzae]
MTAVSPSSSPSSAPRTAIDSAVHADVAARLRAAGCVFAEDEARLLISAAPTPGDLAAMAARRAGGSPLEHVLGWADFCGLRISVEPGVFVPRPRTEFLIRQAVRFAGGTPAGRRLAVADICCGSGALGAAFLGALAEEWEGTADLHAVDVDPVAVRCARRNLAALGGRVHEGDLFAALPDDLRGRVDIAIASPPYVPTDAIRLLPPEARVHEPRVALDGGADGLDVVRRLAAQAPQWLALGGRLFVETSEGQAAPAAEAMAGGGLIPRVAASRELDATVVIGVRR